MDFLPPVAQLLLLTFAVTFTSPTFQRGLLLCMAAMLTPGRRTITNLWRTVNVLARLCPITQHSRPRQLSAPRTPLRPGAGATRESCSPSWSSFPLPTGPGRCRGS